MPRKSLDDLIADMGYSDEVASHVKQSVEALQTEQAILNGERFLPHPVDAHKHWLRETGQWGKSEEHQRLEQEHKRLSDEVAELRSAVARLVEKGGD